MARLKSLNGLGPKYLLLGQESQVFLYGPVSLGTPTLSDYKLDRVPPFSSVFGIPRICVFSYMNAYVCLHLYYRGGSFPRQL